MKLMLRGAIVGLVDIVRCEAKTNSKWHERGQYGFVADAVRDVTDLALCTVTVGVL